MSKLMIGPLNINSIRNKFEHLNNLLCDKVDIFLVSETKLDGSFLNSQFHMDGFYPPFRNDRNQYGGGVMFYVRNNIVCRQIDKSSLPEDIEAIFLEINLRKQKWIVAGIYKPPSLNTKYFTRCIREFLSKINSDNIILMGDFNAVEHDDDMLLFNSELRLKNLIKKPTCHKSLQNPSCVDHIWVSDSKRFHHTSILENDLSDYHDVVVTFLNVEIAKKGPKIINYRCYRLFNDEHFKHDLELLIALNNDLNYNDFDEQFSQLVSKHAPIKYKVVRNNNSPFITKAVRKEIMIRSRFKNIYNKHPSIKNWENFKRQRNKCVTVCRDAKRIYYTSLNMNNIFDNKRFWKTVKPIFSNKCVKDTVQVIVENDQIIREKEHIANIINGHFVNVTNSLHIYGIPHENYNDIKNDIENVIKNYEQHPSIIWIN
ncbi:uncharacterized protein LOC130642282 [Hydractinia symbiolongicarpus]|uniref:uncharacterized protein LOC130642282 n=1 Tax=Hydractinia symbiolongicarpus TaxID=13093 RepID=UPI002549F3BB|nr:uncharacterized protein LOC130642282 [Hydractinia symbiolongicarpus]